jgi:hypothetical protein
MQITGSRDLKQLTAVTLYGHVASDFFFLALLAFRFGNYVFCATPKLRYRPILLVLTLGQISIEKQSRFLVNTKNFPVS